jgi:CYTH domain-containing protein
MNKEIERKYLVNGDAFLTDHNGMETITQGYISTDENSTVRVRRSINGNGTVRDYLTIKGKSSDDGLSRVEVETKITNSQADALFEMCDPDTLIKKIRFKKKCGGKVWETDMFQGHNSGLVIAEVELVSEMEEVVVKPSWIGKEVTGQEQYYNSKLMECPYSEWK